MNKLLYFFECLCKEYTHKIRFMLTYESKVKGPIVEQGSCFLHVVCKPTCNLVTGLWSTWKPITTHYKYIGMIIPKSGEMRFF